MQKKQFSPVGSGRFALVLARGANESCYQAAQDAMAGASPVGNCLFFRTPIPGLTGQQIGDISLLGIDYPRMFLFCINNSIQISSQQVLYS